jgi:hypothetical protein
MRECVLAVCVLMRFSQEALSSSTSFRRVSGGTSSVLSVIRGAAGKAEAVAAQFLVPAAQKVTKFRDRSQLATTTQHDPYTLAVRQEQERMEAVRAERAEKMAKERAIRQKQMAVEEARQAALNAIEKKELQAARHLRTLQVHEHHNLYVFE